MIPWESMVWLLVGSLSFFVVGNVLGIALADVVKHPMLLRWKADWSPTATIDWLWQRSVYDLWASPFIGLTLGVGLFSLAISAKYIKPAIASLAHLSEASRKKGYLPLGFVVAMIVGGALAGAAVATALYPSLWWFWLLSWLALPFIQGVLLATELGEVGLGVQIPYVREAFLIAFTKPGEVEPWLVPAKVSTGAGIITHRIKVAMLEGAADRLLQGLRDHAPPRAALQLHLPPVLLVDRPHPLGSLPVDGDLVAYRLAELLAVGFTLDRGVQARPHRRSALC